MAAEPSGDHMRPLQKESCTSSKIIASEATLPGHPLQNGLSIAQKSLIINVKNSPNIPDYHITIVFRSTKSLEFVIEGFDHNSETLFKDFIMDFVSTTSYTHVYY